jgi:hypothetical protein
MELGTRTNYDCLRWNFLCDWMQLGNLNLISEHNCELELEL